ncbi:beta-phosphoglucomutase [Legionella nagasakiensis]|uniref:beta-phosphoglucomutase n=1 Tax=Legionella nagasakiensis TaxID=535290 RepID=UPI001056731F|nr:beta-phosphoglucomutase [Legionella nagasakiensis]
MKVKAVIFDLDGVITDTADYHFMAWRQLAATLGIVLNETDCEALKGIDRATSLDMILAKGGIKKTAVEKQLLAEQKNQCYRSLVTTMTPKDVLPGAEELLNELRQQGLSIGLASASKNAFFVLERLELRHHFDYIADATLIKNNKPHPEIFLTVAESLNVPANLCVGVEDAQSGIKAIKAAGMFAVGIGAPDYLSEADKVYPSLQSFDLQGFVGWPFN